MSCFYSAIKSFGRGPNTAEKKVAPDQTKEVRDVTTLIPSLQNPFINEEFYIKLMQSRISILNSKAGMCFGDCIKVNMILAEIESADKDKIKNFELLGELKNQCQF